MKLLFHAAFFLFLAFMIVSDIATTLVGALLTFVGLAGLQNGALPWVCAAYGAFLLASGLAVDLSFIKGWIASSAWPNVLAVLVHAAWVLLCAAILYMYAVDPPPYHRYGIYIKFICLWFVVFHSLMFLAHTFLISGRVRKMLKQADQSPKEEYN